MNLAHLHLIINHLPVVGFPLTLLFLMGFIWKKNLQGQKFSLIVFVGLSLISLAVFFTGEPAEHLVEKIPGISESLIEPHEEAAEISLYLILLTGGLSVMELWAQRNAQDRRRLMMAVLLLASFTCFSLFYTANLGGEIRHSEIRSSSELNRSSEN